jgi:hypothetical protein
MNALPGMVGGLLPDRGQLPCPLISRKGGCPMITYQDLIQIGILVIGIISLFFQANKKK